MKRKYTYAFDSNLFTFVPLVLLRSFRNMLPSLAKIWCRIVIHAFSWTFNIDRRSLKCLTWAWLVETSKSWCKLTPFSRNFLLPERPMKHGWDAWKVEMDSKIRPCTACVVCPRMLPKKEKNVDLKQKSKASIHMRTAGSYEGNFHFFVSPFMVSKIQPAYSFWKTNA